MEAVISFIFHEGIAQKLGKCSYIENKEARQGMHLALFMYFPAANCWEEGSIKMRIVNWLSRVLIKMEFEKWLNFFTWSFFKTWSWNKNLSIKAVDKNLSKSDNWIVPRPQWEFYGI